MLRSLERIGFALCLLAGAVCAVMHVATFVAMVPFTWLILPFGLMFVAVICIKAAGNAGPRQFSGRDRLLACGLLLYAVLTFVYFYRITDGATSVKGVGDQYVSTYKDLVIRTITVQEYAMFPNLWVRVMISFIGLAAAIAVPVVYVEDPRHRDG